MASIKQRENGKWYAAIDLKRFHFRTKKEGFDTKQDATDWAGKEEERVKAQGENRFVKTKDKTLGELITDYVEHSRKRGKRWSPSKQYNLDKLVEDMGACPIRNYNRHKLFDYCAKMRETRGPSGAQERLIYLGTVLKFGRQRLQLDVPLEEHQAGMAVLREDGEHGGISKSKARNLNFEQDQIETIKAHLHRPEDKGKLIGEIIDILQIVPFRVSELCGIKWTDLDPVARTVWLRDVKDRSGPGVDRLVTLTMIGDVDTYELIAGRARTPGDDRVFPIASTKVSEAWSDANRRAGIDMHVHDTRHHAISELFTTHGWDVPAVVHYTGHKDWKVLASNYGQLAPRQMHEYAKRQKKVQAYLEQIGMGHNGGPSMMGGK